MPVVLQQALFASVRSGENEGYQIAGHSPGIDAETRRELTAWGPSHDSLQSGRSENSSINGHSLADGRYCLSLTRATSGEYSGRGENVSTAILLAGDDALALCGQHPLRLLEAAMSAGWTSGDVAETVSLVGRAQATNLEAVAGVCGVFPAEAIAALVEYASGKEPLGIVLTHHQRLVIDALLSLLPLEVRRHVSFTTGLLPSAKRAFRVHLLAPHTELTHQFVRVTAGKLLDLLDPQVRPATDAGQKLAELLRGEHWSAVAREVERTKVPSKGTD
jgi:hypothetical protein